MHKATQRFWAGLENLPKVVQRLARKNFELLTANPRHPALHFKKVGRFWSARVGISYWALAIKDREDFIWVWIGTHDEYDRMVKRKRPRGLCATVLASYSLFSCTLR